MGDSDIDERTMEDSGADESRESRDSKDDIVAARTLLTEGARRDRMQSNGAGSKEWLLQGSVTRT